ncbi:MFS transporter [Desulfofundulus thermobenzoicus]|uniref:MFS transporter n=1 Tax=Desulfofundulus thermobenzoicus TaxID=29376 RepID=A0A6N7IR30_9FIRM|nr:MFS transporter [Desulfofundulus thermobenzoicus]MQL51608.1 MFS transporter [Desulfofundulus thermobenzoicus]
MINIILLGLTSLFTDISSEMIYPLVPIYLVNRLGATPAIVGLIEGMAESLASLLKVFSGYYSDRFQSRKAPAIGGYGLSALAKILIVFSTSWTWVLWGRIGDRFGKGVRTAPRDALIAESSPGDRLGWAYGLHRMLDTLGAAAGVVLAYYFFTSYHGSYHTVFAWSLVPAFLGVGILFLVKETGEKSSKIGKKLDLSWSGLDSRLKKFLVVVFIFALGNSSNQFLLLRAHDLGFNTPDVILLYLAFNLVYAVVSFPAGALSDRIGRRVLLVAGYVFYGLVYLGFALVQRGQFLWVLFPLYGVYNAVTEGVEKALVAEIAPPEQKATLIGLHATLVGVGLLPASLLGGALWNFFGAPATFYFGGIMGLLAALGVAVVLSGEKPALRQGRV